MKITQITVSYGATQSLPEYSNCKPSLTLTATINEGEDPVQAEAQLWDMAKYSVHQQIDAALESCDKAARYSTEPRYQVLRTYHDYYQKREAGQPPIYVAILPNEVTLDKNESVRWVSPGFHDTRKVRLSHARRMAAEVVSQDNAILIDCSDGDLSRLAIAVPPQRTAPEHLEDTLDYGEQDRTEEEWEEEEEEEEEPRDFVAERMARTEVKTGVSDEGPDNSM